MSYVQHLEEIKSEWVEMSNDELFTLFGYNEIQNDIPEEVFSSVSNEEMEFRLLELARHQESVGMVQPPSEDTETVESQVGVERTCPIDLTESVPPVCPLLPLQSLSSAVLPFE